MRNLVEGYKKFHKKYFANSAKLYQRLVRDGQSPTSLVIACSDSRVDPSILFNCKPGEIFVVRNVANLVPPCEPDDKHHGTSAAIEFAVNSLGIRNIVILGHSKCAGIRHLMTYCDKNDDYSFVTSWVKIAEEAKKTTKEFFHEDEMLCCEHNSLLVSYKNLLTFHWVKSLVDIGELKIFLWHFCLETGEISEFNHEIREFAPIEN